MADWTVAMVRKGWAGDIRRNTVVVTGTNADTLPPTLVGMAHIHAIVPTGHNGSIAGKTCIPAGGISISTTETSAAALSLFTAAASPQAFANSSAELFVFGV
jgi:hypothetical protein